MIEEITQHLELIDEGLALDGLPVNDRPFHAAWTFVREFVIEVDTGNGLQIPGELTEFVSDPWFRYLYTHIEEWYRTRYGTRLDQQTPRTFNGVTLIASTPFELNVPVSITYPGVPGETVWLTYPDSVLNEEDVTKWFASLPNMACYSQKTRQKALQTATDVASKLRAISCRLTGADVSDDVARGFLSGVTVHLESASLLILREEQEGSFARAQWELQMTCESAYKGLLQQQTSNFTETHDLFTLHDHALPYSLSVPRNLLHALPRWREAADLRYGQGDQPSVIGIFKWYQTVLTIVAEVLRNLKRIDLANTRIEIRKAPWRDV